MEKDQRLEAKLHGMGLLYPLSPSPSGELARRFKIPSMSALNARSGEWQRRKRAWLSLGIKGEMGRGTPIGGSPLSLDRASSFKACRPHQSHDPSPGRDAGLYQGGDAWLASGKDTGTSVFDPVLCELIYYWFCLEGGQVLDPFAGGSVRGIVAHEMGFRYWGCDLRQEQIDANCEQAVEICPKTPPTWICGDALDEVLKAPKADLIFSCPPYGDLERYSDDPRDLSTMEYYTFIATLKRIVLRCWKRLRQNRFACFVVSEFRDSKGFYRNFVGDTVRAFQAAGFQYYNEACLVMALGSLPIRITKQFEAGRKLGKTHQNVLVFVKGDPRKWRD